MNHWMSFGICVLILSFSGPLSAQQAQFTYGLETGKKYTYKLDRFSKLPDGVGGWMEPISSSTEYLLTVDSLHGDGNATVSYAVVAESADASTPPLSSRVVTRDTMLGPTKLTVNRNLYRPWRTAPKYWATISPRGTLLSGAIIEEAADFREVLNIIHQPGVVGQVQDPFPRRLKDLVETVLAPLPFVPEMNAGKAWADTLRDTITFPDGKAMIYTSYQSWSIEEEAIAAISCNKLQCTFTRIHQMKGQIVASKTWTGEKVIWLRKSDGVCMQRTLTSSTLASEPSADRMKDGDSRSEIVHTMTLLREQ